MKIAGNRYRKVEEKQPRVVCGVWRVKLNWRGNKVEPNIEWSQWNFWVVVGQLAFTAITAFSVWFSNRDKARSRDIKDIKESTSEDIKAVETRVTKLETGAITHKELGEVHEKINDIMEKVSKMDGKMEGKLDGVIGTVDMIQQWLLNNGGKQ